MKHESVNCMPGNCNSLTKRNTAAHIIINFNTSHTRSHHRSPVHGLKPYGPRATTRHRALKPKPARSDHKQEACMPHRASHLTASTQPQPHSSMQRGHIPDDIKPRPWPSLLLLLPRPHIHLRPRLVIHVHKRADRAVFGPHGGVPLIPGGGAHGANPSVGTGHWMLRAAGHWMLRAAGHGVSPLIDTRT